VVFGKFDGKMAGVLVVTHFTNLGGFTAKSLKSPSSQLSLCMPQDSYYKEKLSAERLLRCYEMAPPRIKQYLEAEIRFVISHIHHEDVILELGCGYGRVMREVSPFAGSLVGNDISRDSLGLAKSYLKGRCNCSVFLMDASRMAFRSGVFDVVFCVQNGISAFGVDRKCLIAESIRVVRKNGMVLFSTYSSKIWNSRLEWFRRQSEAGLIGEIDEGKTGDGTIVCKDGFVATTLSGDQLIRLFNECGLNASIVEVNESSIFAYTRKTVA
jgi:SAM-dependent methyltransferase